MSATSLVDDILASLSHLPGPAGPSTHANTISSSTRYKPGQQSPPKAGNPLMNLPPDAAEDAKSLFLTLHFLFPHELLPALDLLDRRLVTRLISASNASSSLDTDAKVGTDTTENDIFYVQSASASTHHQASTSGSASASRSEPQGRFRNAMSTKSGGKQTYYEVRLDSWNCSCAAFAFSCFTALSKAGDHIGEDMQEQAHDQEAAEIDGVEHTTSPGKYVRFGGTLTRPNTLVEVPVCKHILAAVMARAAPGLFVADEHVNVRREVEKGELAGWGAGWGD